MQTPPYRRKLLIISSLLFLIAIIFERSYVGGNDWRFTHWLFNYQIEFVKRGLLGEILTELNFYKSYANLQIIWLCISCSLSIIYFYIISRTIHFEKTTIPFLLFSILALTSSGTLQHFIYDFGRFDSVNLILLMVTLLIIPKINHKVLPFLIATVASIMILIHEASFFLFVPLMISYWYFIDPKDLSQKLIVSLFIVFITFLVSTKGKFQSENLNQHYTQATKEYGTNVSKSSLAVLHRDFNQNVEFTIKSINQKRIFDYISFIISSLPIFILFFVIFKSLLKLTETNITHILLVLACFAPLALYPLGEDHFRWWSIVITNIFIIVSLLAYHSEAIYNIVAEKTYHHKKLIFTAIIFSFLLGPLGNPSAYPFTINQFFIQLFEL